MENKELRNKIANIIRRAGGGQDLRSDYTLVEATDQILALLQDDLAEHYSEYEVLRKNSNSYLQRIEELEEQVRLLPPKMSEEEIAKILLDTFEKELNQSIGFMLTDNDARIFAKALSEKIEKPKNNLLKMFPISACCNASVRTTRNTNGDMFYHCEACNRPCNLSEDFKPISNSGCKHEWVNYIGEFAKLYCKKCGIDGWEVKPSKEIEPGDIEKMVLQTDREYANTDNIWDILDKLAVEIDQINRGE